MKRRIVIATHIFIESFSQALRDYLLREKNEVLFIGQPLFGNPLSWTMDAIDTFWQVIKTGKKYDIYIGVNNLNTFIGLQLRRFGVVHKTIYSSVDYAHERFNNRLLNNLYHWLDYYCLRNADIVWNSSPAMVLEREKRGIPKKYREKQVAVSDGTDPVKRVPFNKRNRYEIAFVGHFVDGMGLEMLISSFAEIKKQIPQVKLLMIGGGPIEEKLKQLAKNQKDIEFTGIILNLKEVYSRITKSMIGIAPYEKNKYTPNTDPGKIKLYLACGLPIVMTRVPLVADLIDKKKCGIVLEPGDKKAFVNSVIKLLKNEDLLKKCITNSIPVAKEYLWSNVFKKVI